MPQSWQREQTGVAGLEEDIKALYLFVNGEVAHVKTFILNEFSKIRKDMADYKQAAQDAAGALDRVVSKVQDLATQLKNAVAANDMSAVQAVADDLEAHAQSANAALAALDTPAPSSTPDPTPAPADQPPATAPAGSDVPPAADAPSTEPAPQDPANP
jgi:hypothetical protein